MLTMKTTAFAAAIAALVLGTVPAPADARDGRSVRQVAADQGNGRSVRKAVSARRGESRARGVNRRHVQRVDGRRAHRSSRGRGHRRWAPPRRHRSFRPYRSHRRHYAPRRHHYWKRHRHGHNDALLGALFGFAVGAIVADSVHSHDRVYHPPHARAVVVPRPAHGVLIRYEIGRSMHVSDHTHAAVVLEKTRTGHAVEWTNPDTGNRYSMTPTRTFRNAAGEDCREYSVWGWIGGYEEKLTGTACRTNDGAWRTVS